jgi:hypothetical protein
MHFHTQSHNYVQGDLFVDDYCHRIKTMYDDFRNLSAHIDGRTLVLNLLQGLNKKFDSLKTVLKRTKPLLSFREAQNDLLLEELMLDDVATSRSAFAFTTSSGPQQQHQTSTTFGAPRALHPSDNSSGGGGGCNGGRGHGGSSSTSSGGQGKGSPSWPLFYTPWTGTNNM